MLHRGSIGQRNANFWLLSSKKNFSSLLVAQQDKGGQLYEVTEVYRAGAWIDVGIWRALELVAPQVGEPFNCTLALLGYRCSKIKTGMIKWHMFLIRYKMVIISREGKLTLLWEKVELE